MIIRNKKYAYLEDGSINLKFLESVIKEHNNELSKLEKCINYYDGKHAILNRTKSNPALANNKAVHNFAKYISDTICGYVYGNPVSYQGCDKIVDQYVIIDEDGHNAELGLDCSIYGKAYELLYTDDTISDRPITNLATLDPRNTFVVYDNTIGKKAIMGITISANYNLDNKFESNTVTVYDENFIYTYNTKTRNSDSGLSLEGIEAHSYKGVPILRLTNNKYEDGDFECVYGLIDLYNILENDRINDKEQLVDALLVVIGEGLGDDEEEVSETAKTIKDLKILELEQGSDAKYLVKTMNETEIEVLKKAIEEDIHKFSKVPNMSDQNFVGNSSGEAMKYKLLAFEQLGKAKERQFKKFLRDRLILINNLETTKVNGAKIKLEDIAITMKRTLPVNLDEKLKELQGTEGILSLRTRLQRYDEDLDIDKELEQLAEEQKQKAQMMSEAYGNFNFNKTNNNLNEDNETKDNVNEDKETEDKENKDKETIKNKNKDTDK